MASAAPPSAAAWVPMCQPSAVNASEPVHQPATNSTAIVTKVTQVTASKARPRAASPASPKAWLWRNGLKSCWWVFIGLLIP